jgi:hypothetical protein
MIAGVYDETAFAKGNGAMKKRGSSKQLSGGCLSLFGLPFFAAGIFMSWLYFSGFAKWWSARGWDEVPCRIVGAGLKANHDSDGTTYRATADYRYSYEGRMYQGDQVSFHNGADNVGDFQQRAHRELSGYLADADADENARMFRCFVNPKDATESVLYRTLRWEMQAFLAIFALTFPAIGAGLVLGGMMSGAAARKTAALRIRHPDEPWKWQPQWSAKPIRESSGPWRTGLYFYTLWSGIIVAALVGAATLGGAFENGGAAWLLLVFVALWCVPGWFSLRQFRHRMAVGEAGFHAKEIPTCPGGVMEGAILLQRPPPMRRPVEVDLVCEKSITRKSGDGDSTTTEKVWSHRETVPTDAIVRDLSGFRVPVRIAVPADAPESGNGEDSSIRHTWKLRLKVPGTAIDSAFEVPVFRTAGPPTLPVSPASGAPSILDEAAADLPERLAGRRIRAEFDASGAPVTIVCPPARHRWMIVFMIVFNLIWTAAAVFLIQQHAPLIFRIVWPVSAAAIWLGVIWSLLHKRTVTFSPLGLEVRNQLGPVTWSQSFGKADLIGFPHDTNMSSGNTNFYRIRAESVLGKRQTLVDGITEVSTAAALANRLEAWRKSGA